MLDTSRYTEELEKVGFSKEQAGALMNCQFDMFEKHFASKADINALRTEMVALKGELKQDIASLEGELKRDIASLDGKIENTKNEMIIKLGAMTISGVIITIGSMGLMFRLL